MKVIESSFMNDNWKYWDKFIGEKYSTNHISVSYSILQIDIKTSSSNLTQYIIIDKELCCGVCIVRHIPCTMIFNILLIAKEKGTGIKRIGKTFIDYLYKTLPEVL